MDLHELFLACRQGDLSHVQYLTEDKEVELNVRDKWDSTPLYYACLCGHEDVVKYLLTNGARCEENTFDGERCLYGALTDSIKKVLQSFKAISKTIIRRDSFFEFLRRILERGCHADMRFIVNGVRFQAHRCVLAARSQYFNDAFKNKWLGKDTVSITNKMVRPTAFQAILKYLYTGQLEAHIDQLEDTIMLARHCQLNDLLEKLEDRMKKVVSFEMSKPGVNVTMISIEPSSESKDFQMEFGVLADQAMPPGFYNQADVELPFPPEEIPTYPDVIFAAEGHYFYCHKVFMCERSEYFKIKVDDRFGESLLPDADHQLQIILINEVSSAIFVQILYYIYQDSCLQLNPGNAYDVLCAADMFLLPGLKRHCANELAQDVDLENCVITLQTARLFTLPHLEDRCAEFIANNIEKVVQLEEFAYLVQEDAQTVQQREETDSIPIIDDVRFYITNFVQTYSDMSDADEKLAIIDKFLDQLDLEA